MKFMNNHYGREAIFGNRVYCNAPLEGDGTGAEGEGDGTGTGGGGGASVQTDPKDGKRTFDDVLSDKELQAEFDRRLQKALDTQKSKLEVLFDEKATEAEKLAKMNEREKAQYLQQKREKEISDRESSITKRELMAEAKNTLTEKKLPLGLAEVLDYTDADKCNASIAAVESAFNEALEAAVQDRLKGSNPDKKAPDKDDKDTAKQVENLMMGI